MFLVIMSIELFTPLKGFVKDSIFSRKYFKHSTYYCYLKDIGLCIIGAIPYRFDPDPLIQGRLLQKMISIEYVDNIYSVMKSASINKEDFAFIWELGKLLNLETRKVHSILLSVSGKVILGY
jgi:hypothetical protein